MQDRNEIRKQMKDEMIQTIEDLKCLADELSGLLVEIDDLTLREFRMKSLAIQEKYNDILLM